MQLGFAKGHHKITPREQSGRNPGLEKLPNIFGFPFNISATIEVSDFKIGRLVGFTDAHHKIPPRRKRGRSPVLGELTKIWRFPINIYAMAESIDFKFGTQFGWPIRPIIKSHK